MFVNDHPYLFHFTLFIIHSAKQFFHGWSEKYVFTLMRNFSFISAYFSENTLFLKLNENNSAEKTKNRISVRVIYIEGVSEYFEILPYFRTTSILLVAFFCKQDARITRSDELHFVSLIPTDPLYIFHYTFCEAAFLGALSVSLFKTIPLSLPSETVQLHFLVNQYYRLHHL